MGQFADILVATRRSCKDATFPDTNIATIAVIRKAVSTITQIVDILSPALTIYDLNVLYAHRRNFLALVPRIGAVYDATSRLLQAKGATSTPTAAKLAATAKKLREIVITLRERVDISAEYHELAYDAMTAIRNSFESSAPSLLALKQSISVLPDRIDAFCARTKSLPAFHSAANMLAKEAAELANRLEQLESQLDDRHPSNSSTPNSSFDKYLRPLHLKKSPYRPKIALIRGVTVRKTSLLDNKHKPLTLLTDSDGNTLQETRHRQSKATQSEKENMSLTSKKAIKALNSQISPPSELRNRILVEPLGPIVTQGGVLRNNHATARKASRIAPPTIINDVTKQVSFVSDSDCTIVTELPYLTLVSPGPDAIDTPIPTRRMRPKPRYSPTPSSKLPHIIIPPPRIGSIVE